MEDSRWKNKIVGHAEYAVSELTSNPLNPRSHPDRQRRAFRGVIEEVGFIAPLIVNKRTGHLIDGHMRLEEAMAAGIATLPVTLVDLTLDEERRALATFDPIAELAQLDREKATELLDETTSTNSAVMQLLTKLAADAGVIPKDVARISVDDEPDDEEDDRPIQLKGFEPPHLHHGSPTRMVICPECGCEFER